MLWHILGVDILLPRGSGLRDGWGSAEEKFVARKTGYSAPFSPPVFPFSSRRYFEFTSILFCTEIFVLKKWQPQRENARSPPGRYAGARRLAQFLPHIDCIKVSSLCPESYFPLSVIITNVIMLKFDKNGAKFFNFFFRAQNLDFIEYFWYGIVARIASFKMRLVRAFCVVSGPKTKPLYPPRRHLERLLEPPSLWSVGALVFILSLLLQRCPFFDLEKKEKKEKGGRDFP